MGGWKADTIYLERFDERRESLEWDEEDLRIIAAVRSGATVQFQVHDVRKTSDPTTCFCIRSRDDVAAVNH